MDGHVEPDERKCGVLPTANGIPEPDSPVVTGGGQLLAVRGECNAIHFACMSSESVS